MPGIDALVVGAGPAGLATAIGLARRGARALVVEHRTPPLDKACGEGLMPAGVRLLGELGVDLARLRGAPLRGIRFLDGSRVLEGEFATGHGLGLRRTVLSEGLLEAAARAGVEVRFGCSLRDWRADADGVRANTSAGELRARVLVGADGLGSRIRAQAGLDLRPPAIAASVARRRRGIRRHYRVSPWSDCVEVHWGDGVEAYVTPVARDEVGVAFLWSGAGGDHEALLPRFPALAARLAGAEPTSRVRGAGPFWQQTRARTAPGVALVGDAAGYTDAVTGEGITLALRCADVLAELIAEGAPLARYESEWRRLSRIHRRFASLLGFGVAHPSLRRAAFAALALVPAAFERLLRIAAEEEDAGEARWIASHRSA
ncbi:MAG: NAD(P)/FAD-dependent oxidoreductase [Deltaproteobacteria bacterium]|nr:NAD(P)/FAD-dependent oxidoreductase [Deltaproteobacteria bacterium]